LASSTDTGLALIELGRLLTGTEAKAIADWLDSGATLGKALKAIGQARQQDVRSAIHAAGLVGDPVTLVAVLRGIEGARSDVVKASPLWTMPGHLARYGALTGTLTELVRRARVSVTCTTYNFQESSGMWEALAEAAKRPEISLRVYMDGAAAQPGPYGVPPTLQEVARQLRPGMVFASKEYAGKHVRSHAKFLAIDHRILVVTSANFSWSAENHNIEFGLQLDDPGLTDAVEREMLRLEDRVYQVVTATA